MRVPGSRHRRPDRGQRRPARNEQGFRLSQMHPALIAAGVIGALMILIGVVYVAGRQSGMDDPALAGPTYTSESGQAIPVSWPSERWFGKPSFALNVPESFRLTAADDSGNGFTLSWLLNDSSFDTSLSFTVAMDPAITAGTRPNIVTRGGTIISTGNLKLYAVIGATVEEQSIEGVEFHTIHYPNAGGPAGDAEFLSIAHVDGAVIEIGGSTKQGRESEQFRQLAQIRNTFRQLAAGVVFPSVGGHSGGAPVLAERPSTIDHRPSTIDQQPPVGIPDGTGFFKQYADSQFCFFRRRRINGVRNKQQQRSKDRYHSGIGLHRQFAVRNIGFVGAVWRTDISNEQRLQVDCGCHRNTSDTDSN